MKENTNGLYLSIKKQVIKEQRCSISLIQKWARIGYNQAKTLHEFLINDFIINDKNEVLYKEDINPNQMNVFQLLECEDNEQK